jgi:two-component system LytT family sensor kinase
MQPLMKHVPHDAAAVMDIRHHLALPGAAFSGPSGWTWRGRFRSAILAVLIWTTAGLFQAVPDMIHSFQWPVVIEKFIDAWTWVLLTPAVLLIDRRLQAARQNAVRLSLIYLVLSIPFALIHAFLVAVLCYPIPAIWWDPFREPSFAIYYYIGGWTSFCAFIGILQAFNFYNRLLTSQLKLERVERRLIEARLNALHLQLEPHFLFNALNAISSEVVSNPELVQEMIEDLGALLRRSMDCHGSTEITLAQELAMLDHYLAIQKLRFGDRIAIKIDAEPATLSAMVPSMLLQPLVENAIRHGIERRMSGGAIEISARVSGESLRIEVQDDGVGLPPNWRMEASTGLGLHVTRERLETLYSESGEHHFIISPRQGGGTLVTIQIPLHKTGAEIDGSAA